MPVYKALVAVSLRWSAAYWIEGVRWVFQAESLILMCWVLTIAPWKFARLAEFHNWQWIALSGFFSTTFPLSSKLFLIIITESWFCISKEYYLPNQDGLRLRNILLIYKSLQSERLSSIANISMSILFSSFVFQVDQKFECCFFPCCAKQYFSYHW